MPVSEESKTYHNNYLRVQCYITDRESAEIWRAIEKQLTEKNIEVFGKSEKNHIFESHYISFESL